MENETKKAEVNRINVVQGIVDNTQQVLQQAKPFEACLTLAVAIKNMRTELKPYLPSIKYLMDSHLGFRTDREGKPPYSDDTITDCIITAAMQGLNPAGNQFNIIAGNCYITKQGITHLLKKVKGLTDMKLNFGIPVLKSGGALVSFHAAWKLNGKSDSMAGDVPVKLNNQMGSDGAIGKAERKVKVRMYAQITGSELTDGEVNEDIPMKAVEKVNPLDALEQE